MSQELIKISVVLTIVMAVILLICVVLMLIQKNNKVLKWIACGLALILVVVSTITLLTYNSSYKEIKVAQRKSIFSPTSVSEYIDESIELEKDYFSKIIDFEKEKHLIEISMFNLTFNRFDESTYLQFGTSIRQKFKDIEYRMKFDIPQNNKFMTEEMSIPLEGQISLQTSKITLEEFKGAMKTLEKIDYLEFLNVKKSEGIDLSYNGSGDLEGNARTSAFVGFVIKGETVLKLREMNDVQFEELTKSKFQKFMVMAKEGVAIFYFEITEN